MERIGELLPKLGQIIAEDFSNPRIEWVDLFVCYVFLFNAISNVLSLPHEAQDKVAEAVEEFIKKRQRGEWESPTGVGFRIMEIANKYAKPKGAR